MSKIESLTPEQQARLSEYRDKWLAIGLSTSPADRPRTERAIDQAYLLAGLNPPAKVWCESPFGQALTRAIVLSHKPTASVRASVWDSVRASGYGQHDAAWLGFYDYFREVIGLSEQTEKLQPMTDLAKSAGWFLPHKKICWISERHNTVKQDERHRLHCTNGPAVSYPDGWSIYAWHGVRVSEKIIMKPESISPSSIFKEPDAEIRRVMIDIFGQERFVCEANGTVLDRQGENELLQVALPNDPEKHLIALKLRCPSTGAVYVLRVPPDQTSVQGALAWTFDTKPEEYRLAMET